MTIPVDNFVFIKDTLQKGVVLRHTGAGLPHTVVRHYLGRGGGGLVETSYTEAELIDAGPTTTYVVNINDTQRAALQALLKDNPTLVAPDGPLAYWYSMLEMLPQHERESPGTIHGLCL